MANPQSLYGGVPLGTGYLGDTHSEMHGRTLGVWENVLAYGADPTGVADSTASIQTAVDALGVGPTSDDSAEPAAAGGTVFIPKGVYKITAPIVLKSYQNLVGSGAGSIIKNTAAATSAIQIGNGTENVFRSDVSNLVINGGAGAFADGGHGIWARRWFRSVIDRVWVWGAKDIGIRVQASSYSYVMRCYVQGCQSYGIRLQNDPAPPIFAATYVLGNTLRINYRAGLYMDAITGSWVAHNTIESNGPIGDSLGTGAPNRSINLLMRSTNGCAVHDNYFEQTGAPEWTGQVQIALADGFENRISGNYFANFVGLYLWSETGAVTENTIKDNQFPGSVDPNMLTSHAPAIVSPVGNQFIDNRGMNWFDNDGQYNGNIVTSLGSIDGQKRRTVEVAGGSSFTPDLGVINSGTINTTGRRKGRVFVITLDQAMAVQLPTNAAEGEEITFVFVQNGTGGHAVTFPSGNYKQGWVNTGNTANKRSSIRFMLTGANWDQIGAQSPYV